MMKEIKGFMNRWGMELFLFFSAAALFFVVLPFLPIVDGDTFYYIAKAKKILVTGDWLNRSSLMAKPVLGIWAMALSFKVFGVSLFSTYFWHSLFSLGTLVVVYLFMYEFVNIKTAQLATAVLLTSLMFFYQSLSPMLDMPMIFLLVLSHWLLYKFIYHGKNYYLVLTALFCGLNFLTKGLLGAILPAITFVLYLFFVKVNPFKEYKNFLAVVLISIAVFGLVIAVWLTPQVKAHGSDFVELMYRENIVRFFKPIDETGGYREVSSSVQRDPHLNISYLFFSLLPWSAFILPVIFSVFKKQYFGKKNLFIFLFCWFGFVLLITTISGHYKGPRYLLPLFPASAMLIGFYLNNYLLQPIKQHKKLIYRTFAILSWFVALLFTWILLTNFQHGENQYKPFVLTFFGMYLVILFSGFYYWKRDKTDEAIIGLIKLTLVCYLIFIIQASFYVKKIFANYNVANYLKNNAVQSRVVVWRIKERSLDFYLNRPVKYISQNRELAALRGRYYLVTEKNEQKKIKNYFRYEKSVFEYNNWIVFKI